jgi:hypothetical protein
MNSKHQKEKGFNVEEDSRRIVRVVVVQPTYWCKKQAAAQHYYAATLKHMPLTGAPVRHS